MSEKVPKSENLPTPERDIVTSTMFAIPVGQDIFDQVFENLPKEYCIESVLKYKKKFPHITICRPVKSPETVDSFQTHPSFQEFVKDIYGSNKGMVQSQDFYTVYDQVSDSTFVCLRFGFDEGFGDRNLNAKFLGMREALYTQVKIDSLHKGIPLHLTLSEVPGKLELPNQVSPNNFSHNTSFSPRICQKVSGLWRVLED